MQGNPADNVPGNDVPVHAHRNHAGTAALAIGKITRLRMISSGSEPTISDEMTQATAISQRNVSIRRRGLADEKITEAAALYVDGKSLAWLRHSPRCLPDGLFRAEAARSPACGCVKDGPRPHFRANS